MRKFITNVATLAVAMFIAILLIIFILTLYQSQRVGECAPTYQDQPLIRFGTNAQTGNLVLCEYDVLTTEPLDGLERHPTLGHVPVMAVSLTRRPDEVNLLDVNGIAGFLYLPTLRVEDATRIVGAARPPADFTFPSRLQPGPHPLPAAQGW